MIGFPQTLGLEFTSQSEATGMRIKFLQWELGSGLIDQSQKMTVAARATAEKKAFGQRS